MINLKIAQLETDLLKKPNDSYIHLAQQGEIQEMTKEDKKWTKEKVELEKIRLRNLHYPSFNVQTRLHLPLPADYQKAQSKALFVL